MSEDERTVWCGNLSEKVTEELLYELFLQAGPVENVKIPRDSDRRQRSYAFITYVHECSVEYAIKLFEGTSLYQRKLTLHKKQRNGPNSAASPHQNFNTSSLSNRSHLSDSFGNTSMGNVLDVSSMMMFAPNPVGLAHEQAFAMAMNGMLAQMGNQMLGACLPPYDDGNQQGSYRSKMRRNDRDRSDPYERHYDRHSHGHKPYSRDDRDHYQRSKDERRRHSDPDRDRHHDRRRRR
ncbi:RNA-binding protein 7-like [Anopheles albimanus]|uniref:RRM domain-containing protein n=1 Tax=Anopheles albimanus TaxID=7167 RepID=A0A8W7JCU4_ANOAL|nr:RNA-binding protein 7-like [Anopheles albimanus]